MDESYKKLHKEYYDLYKGYDEAKEDGDGDEMIRIKEKVDSLPHPHPKKDSDFQPYPDNRNKKFQDIIYRKAEFHSNQLLLDTTGIDDTCNSEFSIKAHQSFLKNFMTKESPYRSLLIYHGVGVGKTCSGLTVAENFRDIYARKDKRILILSSKNIQIGWKKTIYDPTKGSNQCTGDTFMDSGYQTERHVNKLIKQYYEIMAYQSFSNFVQRMVRQYTQSLPDKDKGDQKNKDEQKKECIRNYFSNRLLIIDEVHNIRDEQGSTMRDAVKTIEEVIKYSDNLRLVLLTATPMYNRSTEILWILNMMLLNDNRPTINKDEVFKDNKLTTKGEAIIKDKCRGYISYLRGENPITFPIRLYPGELNYYPKLNIINNENEETKPLLNLVGGKIKGELQFLDLFGSQMKGRLQLQTYNRYIKQLLADNPDIDLDARGEVNPITDNIKLTQITDMVYPPDKDNLDELSLDEFYGEKGLMNCMNHMDSKYTYKPGIKRKYGPIFDKKLLPNFSCKMANIIKSVDESNGIVFIYTNYIYSGIIPLQLALEQNGYKKHTGEPTLKYPEWTKSSDNIDTKREPISYKGEKRTDVLKRKDRFIQGKYMVIDGSTTKKILQHQLKIINSDDNKYGEKIKIIIGTVVASEGLDFKRVRSVHILDPWLHLNRIEQTVGRAIRFCSHADLPDNEKNVLIYLHVATLPNKQESIDMSIYRYAEKKSIEIGKVEDLLKRGAVDRYLFRDVNVIRKGDIQKVIMKSSIYKSKPIIVDPSDTGYSKVCSYLPVEQCDYNKGLPHINVGELDEDTFFEQYSSSCIHNLKKKISLLYKEAYVYDLNFIKDLLTEYGFNQETMIYLAINEMVMHKFMVYDKYGNSGHVINVSNYYVFQPNLLEDDKIPLYYRMNLIDKYISPIMLPRLDEVIDTCDCNKQYLDGEEIEDVYNKLNNMLDTYESDNEEANVISVLDLMRSHHTSSPIYSDMSNTHLVVVGYLFDRLSFEDKCKLLFGKLYGFEYKEFLCYDSLNEILHSFIIYKSKKSEEYYFNNELKDSKGVDIFGFVLSYNNKPCFYQYYNEEIIQCHQVQIININKSLKRYSSTTHCKQFKNSTPTWGYTIIRTKGYNKKCAFKFVQPSDNGKPEPTKWVRDGPGNVCMEHNIGSRVSNIKDIIKADYPKLTLLLEEMAPEKNKDKKSHNKKDICFLLEIALRYNTNNSFYPYDKVWLKYN